MAAASLHGLDGEQYEYDEWHRLPFTVRGREMLPTVEESHLLFIKLDDGTEMPWRPFFLPEETKRVSTPTHWMVKRQGWYSI